MIEIEWVRNYVNTLLKYAEEVGPSSEMGKAALSRSEAILDMIEAWQKEKQ